MSVVVAGAASTLALGRAQVGNLGADLDALISADYSADPAGKRLAPLDAEIGDAVRQDELRLEDRNDDFDIVDVFYVDPPENTADEGGPESGTETPGGSPTPQPPPPPPTPTPTPQPGPAPTPTPTPVSTPTPIPPSSWCAIDVNLGFVENTSPCNGATGVPVWVVPIVQFNQPMNPATITSNKINLTLNSVLVPSIVTYDPGLKQATIVPLENLQQGMTYKLKVSTVVENADGQPQGFKVEVFFTTAP